MKRLLVVAMMLVVLLSACTLTGSSTPAVDVVQTSVALTLTAYPTQTPPAPPSATPEIATPTSEASATIELPTPTLTVAPPPVVPPAPAPSWNPAYADQFVRYYYQRINARDYNTTWSLLTDSFKLAVNGPSLGGYQGYVDFWDTVQRVDILSVSVTSLAGSYATVGVDMVYNYKNGSVIGSYQPFHLYYNAARLTWMFDSATGTVPTSPPYPATPDQFIYYYFNNINLRNYGLTWSLLSPSFIANNNSPAQGGYAGYVNFWNSVSRVDITYVSINSQGSGYADVTVGMTLNYASGIVTYSTPLFHLIYNSGIASWQFYSP